MTDNQITAGKFISLCFLPLVMTACGGEPAVSFSQDVQPIIKQHCVQCHESGGVGEVTSGFNLATYEGLMKGTSAGPMVIAGDVEGSNMLVLMEGRADPSISMPHGQNEPVAKEDIQTIRSWIGQGAKNN
ncbi:MAG: c-type cytochrome domain-containing protein [Lysobacterales bacterium]